jgi:hypothetical protein
MLLGCLHVYDAIAQRILLKLHIKFVIFPMSSSSAVSGGCEEHEGRGQSMRAEQEQKFERSGAEKRVRGSGIRGTGGAEI